MPASAGILYVVATPIGHLGDITLRALEILRQVDLIAAEDTRHCRRLLSHYDISTPTTPLHEHNERHQVSELVGKLTTGLNIALVSDAGTPLINDPGFPLVSAALERSLKVVPIPGPCAAITALSAAGLPTDRFVFEGFPPRQKSARCTFFKRLRDETRTLILYESSHRLKACLTDLAEIFPPDRRLVIAKELTKIHESLIPTQVSEATGLLGRNPELSKGEFVLLLAGASRLPETGLTAEQRRILHLLLSECSLKTAVQLAEKITGVRKKLLYTEALDWQQQKF